MIRREFTGMLPAAIAKFEELLKALGGETAPSEPIRTDCEACSLKKSETLKAAPFLAPQILKGYDASQGKDSLFSWGVACRIRHADMKELRSKAEALGIIWLSDDGDMAYTGGLKIADFKTFRVGGDLKQTTSNMEVR